jgi:hypothetical protein
MADRDKGKDKGKDGGQDPAKSRKDRRVIPFEIIQGGKKDQTADDFFASRSKQKAKDGATSPISKAAKDSTMSGQVLDAMLNTLALEEGKLLFEQEQEELRGYLDLEIIDRRVKIIGQMSNMILKRRAAMSKRGIDLHSAQFRMVLESFIDLMREAMLKSGMSHGKIEAVMVEVADRMEGWETEIQHKLSGDT